MTRSPLNSSGGCTSPWWALPVPPGILVPDPWIWQPMDRECRRYRPRLRRINSHRTGSDDFMGHRRPSLLASRTHPTFSCSEEWDSGRQWEGHHRWMNQSRHRKEIDGRLSASTIINSPTGIPKSCTIILPTSSYACNSSTASPICYVSN